MCTLFCPVQIKRVRILSTCVFGQRERGGGRRDSQTETETDRDKERETGTERHRESTRERDRQTDRHKINGLSGSFQVKRLVNGLITPCIAYTVQCARA